MGGVVTPIRHAKLAFAFSPPTNPRDPPTSALAMPSRGVGGRARTRRSCRRQREAATTRGWAGGLGTDVLLAIFRRLDHIDILMSADNVCRPWRRAAREEPSLWRRITMRGHKGIARRLNRGGMACEAVRRCAGCCEAFCGQYAGDDGFLMYLIEQAPCLKSLRLISCNLVSNEGLTEAVKELPLLEELELSLCPNIGGFMDNLDLPPKIFPYRGVYTFVSDVCPQLKHLRLSNEDFNVTRDWNKNKDVRGIARMHGLRSLQLFGNIFDNEGLETVLDSCPHLESLDIRHCFNVDMDETLLLKCAKLKTLRLPDDSTDDYDLEFKTPITISMCVTDDISWSSEEYYFSGRRCQEYLKDSDSDSGDDTDFFGEPSRYECDLDKYDRMLPMSMRTFLK